MLTFMKRSISTLALITAGAAVLLSPCVFADGNADTGAHHPMAQGTTRTMVDYVLPQVNLVRDDGKTVLLADELNDGRPVVLNFIYTTCTGICPLSSQVFSQLQEKLGATRSSVHLVSISIDPEEDTPARLVKYAKKYKAGPQWQYYTGTMEASLATQRAFDVYRGDKMAHDPVIFLRASPGKPWLRINGFVTADDLLSEFRGLVAVK